MYPEKIVKNIVKKNVPGKNSENKRVKKVYLEKK